MPVGYIVFSSETRTLGQIQDLALNRVRPAFATLPGVTSPPPFGGNQRTIVVTVNPDRLRSYNMSPDEVVQAINNGNTLQPAGNVRTGSLLRIAQSDAITPNIQTLADLPIRTGAGPTVYLHNVGVIQDSTDIPTGYALVNSRRAVYIPVTKRPDASTVAVVNEVKKPEECDRIECDQAGQDRNRPHRASPPFINEGEKIKVDTAEGTYLSRA